jgi:hypothetical protein
MTQPPPPPPPPPNTPLDYVSPANDPKRPAGGVPFIAQIIIGFASYFAAVLAGVFGAVLFRTRDATGFILSITIMGAALIVLVEVARIRWRWRGMALGALIGFGVSLLGCGICAAMMWGP